MREQKSCIHRGEFKKKKYMCCVFKKMQKTTAGPELGFRWGMATPLMRECGYVMFRFNFRVVSLSKHIAIEMLIGMLLKQTN